MPSENFIAIGSKGTVIPRELTRLEPPLAVGVNHLHWAEHKRLSAEKAHYREIARRAGGWVSNDGDPFELWPLEDAIRRGLVQVRENVQWQDTDRKRHTGTAYFKPSWTPKSGQPLCLAVSSETWARGHIESKPHRERDRNEGCVATLVNAGEALAAVDSVEWSRVEVAAIVSDYFDMLSAELSGTPYNKAEHNRQLRERIPSRSRSSVEWKHRNISAVLIDFGFPYLSGYKPARNRQHLLEDVVGETLAQASALQSSVEQLVESPTPPQAPADFIVREVPPPAMADDPADDESRPPKQRRAVRKNYLEIESRNRSLGRAGEELVVHFEHTRLCSAGKASLAKRIDHVASSQGDGLGFDIRSFEIDGRERFIEVKTTRFGPLTPFFASRNEVSFSAEQADAFHLYRVFSFASTPELFILPGALGGTCRLDAVLFAAVPA